MNEQYKVNTKIQNDNTVIAHSNPNINLANTNYPSTANRQDIAMRWFKERSRQAKLSFNVAVGLAGITGVLSLVVAVSVCASKISEATAAAGLGLTSGAVSAYCFKLSDDANKRLDTTAKELLEE